MIHSIKVTFESVHMSGPEPAKPGQPRIQLLKWFRFQSVETALRIYGRFHEAGVAQHSQVLRYGGLRHTKLALDLSHRLLRRDQEAQDCAAVRLGNDFEDRFHSLNILSTVYNCQGILINRRPPISIDWAGFPMVTQQAERRQSIFSFAH